MSDVTTDAIERFREVRTEAGGGVVAINRNLALLRSCFNWAIRVGYIEKTPFKRGTEAAVKLSRELPRSRRLEGDEGTRLLARCGRRLRALVEAALETGMRRGELLSLQWKQVRFRPKGEIFLPAQKTKAKRNRRVPMSSRLKAILEMCRTGPDGAPQPLDAYVFGNEIGRRIGSVQRAWQVAVLKSHRHTPEWNRKTNKLAGSSQAAYGAIDLHFHDLRREAGSRWLEGGVPLHKVRDWLGHANIAQTSTYLAGTAGGDDDYMRRFEERRQAVVGVWWRSVGCHPPTARGACEGERLGLISRTRQTTRLIAPALVSMMLPGFRSRCVMPLPVRLVQRVRDLDGDRERLIQRQRPLLQPLGQRVALQVLHHQEVDPVLGADVMERADVRVVQTGDGLRLALEPLLQVRV